MRRLLTMVVTVSGMVISAPALAMAAVPTAGHHAHRAFPVFSLTVTPASARIPVGREIPMTVTVRNNTGQPQQGILTLQLQNAAASHRLAVMLARHCAFERGTTTSECRFSVKPGTATKIDYSLLGTAPGMVTAAFAAAPYLPARQGRVHRSARGSDVTGRAATTSVRLQVINRLHAIKGSHHSLQRHNERYHAGPTNGVQVQLNGPDSATTGQILRYTATVANPSTYAARSVHLSVTLPGGMRGLTLASKTGTCTITHHKASCEFSKIDAGRSASVTVKAAVTGPLARCWCATAPVIARVSVVKCYGPMPKVSTPEAKITTVEKPAEKPATPAAPATHRHNATPPCIAGSAGSMGSTGSEASTGSTGTTGSTGATGSMGPAGSEGSTGPAGPSSAGSNCDHGATDHPNSASSPASHNSPSSASSPGSPGSAGSPKYPGSPGSAGSPKYPGSPGSASSPKYPGSPGSASSPKYPGSPGSASSPKYPGSPGSAGSPKYPGSPGSAGSPKYPGSPTSPNYGPTPKLPTTGAPLLQAALVAAGLLGLGFLALIGARSRSRRQR